MKSVNKAADGALKNMKEVKRDLVSKIRPMSENLINTEVKIVRTTMISFQS